jgi:ABC-type glycerol-3-phosphate transport system substrate-binding protein
VAGQSAFVADSGWGLVVSSHSPSQNAAWDVVKFLTTELKTAAAWHTRSSTIPAQRAGANNPDLLAQPWYQVVLPLLPAGRFVGHLPDRDAVFYEIIRPNRRDVLKGTMSIDNALAAMDEAANATLH